ncbi:13771_t:CDS:10, partial [Acaulospora colombiana]
MDETDLKKMSSKKKKRFERFLLKKQKKEERNVLLEQLSKSSFSSELMKSSRNLGRKKDTMKEKLHRAFHERRLGLPQSDPSVPLFVDQESADTRTNLDKDTSNHKNTHSVLEQAIAETPLNAQRSFIGSALKRGPDGELVMPVTKKKKIKRSKGKQTKQILEDEDSFDSSDSQFDTDDDTDPPEENPEPPELTSNTKRQSFKEWAIDQMGISNDDSSTTVLAIGTQEIDSQRIPDRQDSALQDGVDITAGGCNEVDKPEKKEKDQTMPVKKAFYVPVKRSTKIQTARMELPIYGEEQVIMESISSHSVVIICGETGSGKTTQIPQFLYEAGYGNPESGKPGIIGITQPRRVAAVSMSKRVAQELSLSEQEVSYQIRYDASTSPKTVIKFMTDGVLLRELSNDFLLSKYSVIVIDEAHERNLNTDILIGVISRVLRLRKELSEEKNSKVNPLKVIIMSATLRVTDFTENRNLFDIPPPVVIHFNKRTPRIDHVTEAYKKVCKIHTRLPYGGILVFLTGQNEISVLCKKLRKKFPLLTTNQRNKLSSEKVSAGEENEEPNEKFTSKETNLEVEELDIGENEPEYDDISPSFDTDSEESDSEFDYGELEDVQDSNDPLHVLPLYSLLPTRAQLRVFETPPKGTRLCVVATNVAETSLTIPGVKYVVDCGKVKEREYDVNTGVQSYEIVWTSKSSADQRAGRAGRTSPGHCYRLYSSAVYNDQFQQYTTPEIHRMPIEGVVLQMKSMNIDNVANFPFPTPPDRDQLRKAEMMLKHMGALDDKGRITDLGRTMSAFPISPRFSKMLITGQQHGCLPYIIAIVSTISVGDPFIKDYHVDFENSDEEDDDKDDEDIYGKELNVIQNDDSYQKERRKLVKSKFYNVQKKHAGLEPTSDLLKLLNVVGAYEYAGGTEEFCGNNFVRPKAMQEIHKLRGQLTNIVNNNCPDTNVFVDPKMKPPSALQLKALRQIIAAGFIDQVAVRKGLIDNTTRTFSSTRNVAYKTMWSDDDVFVHSSSVLYHEKPSDYVVYQELHKTNKVWMK